MDEARQTAMLDEIAVMLLAGHETTASVLSWLLWELADAPQEQDTAARLIAAASLGEGQNADADASQQQVAVDAERPPPGSWRR
jgi:cytochrome P450